MSRYPMYKGKETCERCHKPVDTEKAVWFPYNSKKGKFQTKGYLPKKDNQGYFAFGPDCAKIVEKNPDGWKHVGKALKNNS